MQKKNLYERRHEYHFDLTPFTEMCINCVYFVRHYVHFTEDKYVPVDDGHCKRGRLKVRKAFDCCEGFVNRYYDD